ncbi:hypothetical protein BCU68_00875 [Vibrio sp. 10N.286.49.B3]|uniref:GspS/AspS pilotin family protein n=1 Tax=Vibrio sp. 10N.286.49.B3 TaxID=1880855 RepID=UPI000C8504D1|nr:GspS/AspS pilotin family protein [Vibrio sp. 10N.286.49.B3]PMH46891.1 hypothetical protein BCU68_00875 [Vibrio sp. 10N.286.49.B3]
MKKFPLIAGVLAAIALLSGCASSADKEEQQRIEMMAKNRAAVLSTGLPLKSGPLSIMRATAKSGVVEMMMLYNEDAEGAKPISQVMASSINYYCHNVEVKASLEQGLAYRIQLRNSRGQLMVDEFITKATCSPVQ